MIQLLQHFTNVSLVKGYTPQKKHI
jgi:hypothetical protein